jgi:transcriptional regulator with XRE-family HTH domain
MRSTRVATDNNSNVATLVSEYRGLYNRIARLTGVDPSYVSRIARGERTNLTVKLALLKEINRLHTISTKLVGR